MRLKRAITESKVSAFTLVELLTVIAIVGILIALLLPAVQAAREQSRRTTCKNNLKQLALAAIQHSENQGHFPTGGWGASWTGDPDRGWGKKQPGGWIYNILPWLEQGELHDRGRGVPTNEKMGLAKEVTQSPLNMLNCPSRRSAILYPHSRPYKAYNSEVAADVARSDYAASAGHNAFLSIHIGSAAGPQTLASGDSDFPWPKTIVISGIVFLRSEIPPARIEDGLTNTFFAGEKYLRQDCYDSGKGFGDRGHMYQGLSYDNLRQASATNPPLPDGLTFQQYSFGSAHAQGCHMAFCDGSVRTINYDIDGQTYQKMATRSSSD